MKLFYNYLNYKNKTIGVSKFISLNYENICFIKGASIYSHFWKASRLWNSGVLSHITGRKLTYFWNSINSPSKQKVIWGKTSKVQFRIYTKLQHLLSHVFKHWWTYCFNKRVKISALHPRTCYITQTTLEIRCWVIDPYVTKGWNKRPEFPVTFEILWPTKWIWYYKFFLIKTFKISKKKYEN